jgi:SAM-dependent methyltransferase
VQDAELAPGERVLDVGCGRGAALFPAATAVGPRGHVHGIDLAPGMVAATAAEAARRGLAHVTVEVMDAQEPTLHDASYDVVLASLVVFFLPDPLAGLRSWRTALREGGRLAFTTFGPDDERWCWLGRAIAAVVPAGTPTRPPSGGAFADPATIAATVAAAGYADVHTVDARHDVQFADGDQWWRWTWSHGGRAWLERVPADRLDELRGELTARVDALREVA